MLIILISGLRYISANVDLVCGQRALEKISYKCECMSQYYGNPHENCGECRAGYFKFPTCSSMYFGASPHTGSWVPGPGSETQDPEPGTQDPISVPKVDKSFWTHLQCPIG